ncbi:MAG: Rap1a/Tai family immunity protein [Gammaproteobacteria bacterium]|jgi:hypothetical protein
MGRGLMVVAGLAALLTVPAADAETETAADWQDDCAAYVDMLRDEGEADDIEITWCVAKSLGISMGLEAGSRVGAVSMSSTLVVAYDLDRDAVFDLFRQRNAASLLQICMPVDTSARAKILAVYEFLEGHPEKREQPAAIAFFEGLQSRWPCEPPKES